ncbi:MAG TPA: right-handed parallel beta-helix repeat-containing protein [Syntrophales bacterium]|nr:right-handed parallel beta-helix repeat-containing protein [Syntrophales bacterium]
MSGQASSLLVPFFMNQKFLKEVTMNKWITAAVLTVSIMCLTGIAFAIVKPIPGAPVFPVTITQPGSYVLEHNLVVPSTGTTAILVQADNVTIDLNGFAILGPMVCTGVPLVCNHHTGTGRGIDAGSHQNIKVYNGTVSGMGETGININGDGAIIESVRVASNGGHGISIASGTVSANTVNKNGGDGIYVGTGTVKGNTVYKNGGTGIIVDGGGTVSANTVNNNGGDGIYFGDDSTVSTNTVNHNGGHGIYFFAAGGTVNGNTVSDNGSDGIYNNDGTVIANTVTSNGGSGIVASVGVIIANTANNNNFGLGLSILGVAGYVNNVSVINQNGNVTGGFNLGNNLD